MPQSIAQFPPALDLLLDQVRDLIRFLAMQVSLERLIILAIVLQPQQRVALALQSLAPHRAMVI